MDGKVTMGYQWPADKLTNGEMAILYEWRKMTQTPINYLLAQAVNEMSKIIKGDILQGNHR